MTRIELIGIIIATLLIQTIAGLHVVAGIMTGPEAIIISLICFGIIALAVHVRRLSKPKNNT